MPHPTHTKPDARVAVRAVPGAARAGAPRSGPHGCVRAHRDIKRRCLDCERVGRGAVGAIVGCASVKINPALPPPSSRHKPNHDHNHQYKPPPNRAHPPLNDRALRRRHHAAVRPRGHRHHRRHLPPHALHGPSGFRCICVCMYACDPGPACELPPLYGTYT